MKSPQNPSYEKTRPEFSDFFSLADRHFTAVFLIVFFGILSYLTGLHAEFQFDDYETIVENPLIKHLDLNILWDHYKSRFLTNLSFTLNYLGAGLDVFWWRLTNIFIHILSALAVYHLTLLIFKTPKIKRYQWPDQEQYFFALFCALIFLVHPVQTQAVTYIVQRSTCLAGFFYLTALYFYLKARLGEKSYLWAILFAFLGMLTKPIIISLPVAVILCEICFFHFEKKIDARRTAAIIFLALPPLIIALFLFPIYTWPDKIKMAGHTFTQPAYLLTEFNVLVTYIRLLFLPVNQNLDYDYKIVHSFFDFPTPLSFSFLAALIVAGLFMLKKEPLLAFGILFFFITILPQSSFFPLPDVIFEHRLYLSCFGFAVFLCAALKKILKGDKPLKVVLSLIVLIFAFCTFGRNLLWSNSLAFVQDIVKKSPNKARPHNSLGFYYFRQKDYKEAEKEFLKALSLENNYFLAYYNLAMTYCETGRIPEARKMFRGLVRLYPGFEQAWVGLGLTLVKKENAMIAFQRALERNPMSAAAHIGLGNLYLELDNITAAEPMLKRAAWLNPDSPYALYNLGNLYFKKSEFYEAMQYFERAAAIKPDFAQALNNLGSVFYYFGYFEKAAQYYQRAIRLDPFLAEGYFNFANALYELGETEYSQVIIRQAANLYKSQGNAEMAKKIEKKLKKPAGKKRNEIKK